MLFYLFYMCHYTSLHGKELALKGLVKVILRTNSNSLLACKPVKQLDDDLRFRHYNLIPQGKFKSSPGLCLFAFVLQGKEMRSQVAAEMMAKW